MNFLETTLYVITEIILENHQGKTRWEFNGMSYNLLYELLYISFKVEEYAAFSHIAFQYYMLSYDTLRPMSNTISHE
jgi:hypothetical protein